MSLEEFIEYVKATCDFRNKDVDRNIICQKCGYVLQVDYHTENNLIGLKCFRCGKWKEFWVKTITKSDFMI